MERPTDPSPGRPAEMTVEQFNARALARSKRAAMRRRAVRIRRSVVGLTATLFSAAFLAIYVQLASGHDPALSRKQSSTASTPVAQGRTQAESESSTSSSPSSKSESTTGSHAGDSQSPSTGGEEAAGASAVRTSQS